MNVEVSSRRGRSEKEDDTKLKDPEMESLFSHIK